LDYNLINFNDVLDQRCERMKKVLAKKAEEYANGESRYHNFEQAARKRNTSPEDALMGMKIKHDVAVDDLVQWAEEGSPKLTEAMIDEKIGDSINYLVLLEGMLLNRMLFNDRLRKITPSNAGS